MSSEKETRIKTRAYQIWEDEGRADGQHEEHWARATREVELEGDKAGSEARVNRVGDATHVSSTGGGVSGFSGAQSAGTGSGVSSQTGGSASSGTSSGLQRGGTEPGGQAGSGGGTAANRKP